MGTLSRPLHCYLLLSLWILVIVAGMYKYIITVENVHSPKQMMMMRRDVRRSGLRGDTKLQKIVRKYCNNPQTSRPDAEGLKNEKNWQLQGVIAVIRHGDRGPLTHVRDIETVNCDAPRPSQLLMRYQEYINNATGLGKAPWAQSPGPFHNFPLLPAAPTTSCHLGQLTLIGIQQLLSVGSLLGKAYSSRLGWNALFNNTNYSSDSKAKTQMDGTDIKLQKQSEDERSKKMKPDPKMRTQKEDGNIERRGEIVVHSTRYRRALQSALALIWSMLGGHDGIAGAVAYESPSLAFCATDCACPAAEKYARAVSKETKSRLEVHPAIGHLVSQLSKVISHSSSQISSDPHILEDALLAYLCHSSPLPCVEKPIETPKIVKNIQDHKVSDTVFHKAPSKQFRRLLYNIGGGSEVKAKNGPLDFDSQMEKEKLGYYQQKMMENAAESDYQDVVLVKRNMDGDFNFNGEALPNVAVDGQEDDDDEEANPAKSDATETTCVRKEQVTALFAYTDWEAKRSARSINLKKVSILRAYGMIRHMVDYVLRMISDSGPKFVLYSGHDKTIQYLSVALGAVADDLHVKYASRIVMEVYRDSDKTGKGPSDFHFRFLTNGKDVTDKLAFCKSGLLTVDEEEGRADRRYLCRVENVIRFVHEDYFSVFNATNFKDACAVR